MPTEGLGSDPVRLAFDRAAAVADVGRFDEALSVVEVALASFPDSTTLMYLRAFSLRNLGRLPEAIQAAEDTIRADPDYAYGHLELSRALMAMQTAPDVCLHAARRAWECDETVQTWENLIRCTIPVNLSLAQRLLRDMHVLYPDSPRVPVLAAIISRNRPTAGVTLAASFAAFPFLLRLPLMVFLWPLVLALFALGGVERWWRTRVAIRHLDAAIAAQPDHAGMLTYRAELAASTFQYEKAVDGSLAAAASAPGEADTGRIVRYANLRLLATAVVGVAFCAGTISAMASGVEAEHLGVAVAVAMTVIIVVGVLAVGTALARITLGRLPPLLRRRTHASFGPTAVAALLVAAVLIGVAAGNAAEDVPSEVSIYADWTGGILAFVALALTAFAASIGIRARANRG